MYRFNHSSSWHLEILETILIGTYELRSSLVKRADLIYSAAPQKLLMLLIGKAHNLVTSILEWIHRYAERFATPGRIDSIRDRIGHKLRTCIFRKCFVDILHHDGVCALQGSIHIFGSDIWKSWFASAGEMIRSACEDTCTD